MYELYREHFQKHGYDIGESIGHGSYGKVFIVTSMKYKQQFACKIMDTKTGVYKQKVLHIFQSEIETLQQLYHPNIVNTYDYFQEDQFVYIISEYCPGGTLFDILVHEPHLIKENILRYTTELLSAFCFIHSNQIAHLDIKPPNVFLDKYGRLKVADFGLATFCKPGEKKTTICGSALFLPPEMIKKQAYDPFKADVWSLGVSLYLIVVGSIPWLNLEMSEALKLMQAFQPDLPLNCPKAVRDVVKQCLVVDPSKRPSIFEIQKNFIAAQKMHKFAPPSKTLVRPKTLKTFQISTTTKIHRNNSVPVLQP